MTDSTALNITATNFARDDILGTDTSKKSNVDQLLIRPSGARKYRESFESTSPTNDLVERDIIDISKPGHSFSTPEITLAKAERNAINLSLQQKKVAALKECIRCTILSRIAFGKENWMLAKYHTMLATAYLDLKGYETQVAHHCEIADNILACLERSGKKPKESFEFLEMLVKKEHSNTLAQMGLKKLYEAESSLIKAKQSFHLLRTCGNSTIDIVQAWEMKLTMAHGRLYMMMKKWKLSTKYFEKAAELEIENNGANSLGLIAIYQNLGKVEQCKQPADHEKAIEQYLQAHSIAVLNFSSKSLTVAQTSYIVALAFASISGPEAESSAETYLKESLGMYRSISGPSCEKTLEVLDELARLYIRTNRIMDGIKLLESSVPLKEEQYCYYSKEMVATFKLMASGYLSLGEMEKACLHFEKCYAIECSLYGSSHKFVEKTKKILDMLLQNMKKNQYKSRP